MKSSFRTFVEKRLNSMLEMSMGRGMRELSLPTTQPMANLLSMLRGPFMRARALDWLLFDGLAEAIRGRDELVKKVNEAIRANTQNPPSIISAKPKQLPDDFNDFLGKAMMKAESKSAYGSYGEDPILGDPNTQEIHAGDLFSRKAHELRPILKNLKLEGSDGQYYSIAEFYDKYYEPKVMTVDYTPGIKTNVDLRKARAYLEGHGMEGFRYGGFNGYLQYVEAGHHFSQPMKDRSWSPIENHGVDLTFANPAEGPPIGIDARGRPTLNLHAGSYTKDERRSAKTIKRMRSQFADIANRIHAGKDLSDMDPNVVDEIRNVSKINDEVKRSEFSLDPENLPKGPSQSLFDHDSNHEAYFYLPDEADSKMFLAMIHRGLSQPFMGRSRKMVMNPQAIGRQLQENEPVPTGPEGWFRMTNNGASLDFKFSEADQQKLFNYIIEPLHSDNVIRVNFHAATVFPEIKASPNFRIYASALFNAGVRSDKTAIKDFKRVIYTAPDLKTGREDWFVHKQDLLPKEIQDIKHPLNDPVLSPYFEKGYKWEYRNSKERATNFPDFEQYGDGVLKFGTDRYLVQMDKSNGKFYLMVPTGKTATDEKGRPEKLKPADYGQAGNAMLGGGIHHSGGNMGGHTNVTPAGPETEEALINILKNGGLGESIGLEKRHVVNNETQLRCVKEGVRRAKFKYEGIAGRNPNKMDFPEESLISWAVEGLRAFAGDRAFQVGYITQGEIRELLKWSPEKEKEKFYKGQYKVDPEGRDWQQNKSTGQWFYKDAKTNQLVPDDEDRDWVKVGSAWYYKDPEWQPGMGQGLRSLMYKHGIPAEDQDEWWGDLQQGVGSAWKSSPIIDLSGVQDIATLRVIGENAFHARVRAISMYIVDRMVEQTRKATGDHTFGALGGNGEDSEEGSFDAGVENKTHRQGEFEDRDKWGLMNPKDARALHGIEEPEENPLDQPPESPNFKLGGIERPKLKVVPQQSRPSGDIQDEPDEFIDNYVKPQPVAAKPKQQPVSTVQSNAEPDEFDAFLQTPAKPKRNPRRIMQPQRQVPQVQPRDEFDDFLAGENVKLPSFQQWLRLKETEVVFDPKVKVKDGCGFNYEGAPGKTAVSIGGEVETMKTDPDGTGKKGKKKYARKS